MLSPGQRFLDGGHHVGPDHQQWRAAAIWICVRGNICTHAHLRIPRADRADAAYCSLIEDAMAFDRSWIDKYEAGGEHLSQAIRGLTREDLLAAPPAGENIGKWTIQQVVIHLMDSDLISMDRMKRLISMENPLLV